MAEEKKDHAKRLRYALIALVFVGTALNYVDRQVLALLKPTLEAEFNWSDQEFAHLGSAFQLTAAASVLFVGWLVDRFGVRAAYGGAVAIVGNPDQVEAKLRAYQALGIDAFILSGYPHANECDMFARYVLPKLDHGKLSIG